MSNEIVNHVSITLAEATELDAVLQLLTGSGLPEAGLAEHFATTLVARVHNEVVGSAGLEVYGRLALLRSVAVATAYQRARVRSTTDPSCLTIGSGKGGNGYLLAN